MNGNYGSCPCPCPPPKGPGDTIPSEKGSSPRPSPDDAMKDQFTQGLAAGFTAGQRSAACQKSSCGQGDSQQRFFMGLMMALLIGLVLGVLFGILIGRVMGGA